MVGRSSRDVDVAVLGGGPAGSACAIAAAARGLSTVVFDRPRPLGGKPCGEGIMPAGVDALFALGLSELLSRGRPFGGLRHVVVGARPLEVDLPRPGLALRRDTLTAALDGAIRDAGVGRVEGRAAARRTGEGRFVVETEAGPAWSARTLVVADGNGGGAASRLRRPTRATASGGTRFGVRARFRERGGLDRVEVHMGRGCEIYLTPLPEGEVNVSVLFERRPEGVEGADALVAFALDRHPLAAARLAAETTPPTARALPTRAPGPAADRGAFLAGDALGAIDPILGCGVTIALRTGVLAARAVRATLSGARRGAVAAWYAAACRRERRARHVLASLLRVGDGHPRLARLVVGALRALPATTREMARVAAGR